MAVWPAATETTGPGMGTTRRSVVPSTCPPTFRKKAVLTPQTSTGTRSQERHALFSSFVFLEQKRSELLFYELKAQHDSQVMN